MVKTKNVKSKPRKKKVILNPVHNKVRHTGVGGGIYRILTNSKEYKIQQKHGRKWVDIKEIWTTSFAYGDTYLNLYFSSEKGALDFITREFGNKVEIVYDWHTI